MRAILMTASTTIIGLLQLEIGGSRVGGLFYYPLALTVMGGLMSSAVLTRLPDPPSTKPELQYLPGWRWNQVLPPCQLGGRVL